MKSRSFAVILGCLVVGASTAASAEALRPASYTAAQAERGLGVYRQNCQSCHAADMTAGRGVAPLRGPEFVFGWKGKPVGELAAYLKANMPPGQAGSLTDKQYADVIAALLSANGAPAGDGELDLGAGSNATLTMGD